MRTNIVNSIKIVHIHEKERWNEIVCSFTNYDVYYLNGYLKAFQIHGDGEPQLFYYESESLKGMSVVMKRDIASLELFSDILPKNKYFDIVTPYGYGGFLFEGDISQCNLQEFEKLYSNLLEQENIVSEFVFKYLNTFGFKLYLCFNIATELTSGISSNSVKLFISIFELKPLLFNS